MAFPSGPLLFVDAGANVGACTMHMLLATSAKVAAFEPGPGPGPGPGPHPHPPP